MSAVIQPVEDRIELSGIQHDEVHRVWSSVRPLLARVVAHGDGEFTPETILEQLLDRNMQLWIGHEGEKILHAGVTQIITYPTGKSVCEITHLAGERAQEWAVDHCAIIEKWAKEHGCSSVRIIGRKGWAKIHTSYRPLYTTLTKDI